MRMNPVYRREMMVSARSFRLALVMLVFNGILAMVALLNMYSTLARVRVTAEIQYSSFLQLYLFVATLEFVMVIFIMPALTAGSISGERERRTLELMLTTQLTPAQIVRGKLMSSCSTMALLIISSFPVLAMVFIYGGVTVGDMALLLLCYMISVLFVGSLGICCSAIFKRSTLSTVAAYLATALITIGTYGINWLSGYVGRTATATYAGTAAVAYAGGVDAGMFAGSGRLGVLLLVNPITTFLSALPRVSGQVATFSGMESLRTREATVLLPSLPDSWVGCSMALQAGFALLCIFVAVRVLDPERKQIR